MAAYHAIIQACYRIRFLPMRPQVSEKQAERIQSSGLGLITKWSPQQFILNHPVLHLIYYFVRAQYLEFHRPLDGSLHMEVLIVSLNLLRAVSHCRNFL